MSDEFDREGRSFADGSDSAWTALDKSDDDISADGKGSLHFYNSSAVTTTAEGFLNITTTVDRTEWITYNQLKKKYVPIKKFYKSGNVQGWNKFCFTGGIIEIDAIMPGEPTTAGLWPAMWILGNLGRATYEASTNKIWPWSYDSCKRDLQRPQEISACNIANHYGLKSHEGRGATEIDILEIMPGDAGYLPSTSPPIERPYGAMTLQVAPAITKNRPQSGLPPQLGNKGHNVHSPIPAQNW